MTSTDNASSWGEFPSVPEPRGPGPWPRIIGLLVGLGVAAFLVARGRALAAAALVLVVLTVTVASALSPAFERRMARILARVSHLVGRILSTVLLGLVAIVVLVPIWSIARAGGWDTLRIGPAPPGCWEPRRVPWWRRTPERPYTRDEPRSGRQRLHAMAVIAVPLAVVLLAAVPLHGWVMERRADQSPAVGNPRTATGAGQEAPEGTLAVEGQAPQRDGDPLITESAPWAEDALRSRFQIGEYDPTNIMRIRDEDTTYFHYHDRVRASWRPPAEDGIDVWFFGSSQLLGVSIIRDEHTIPSELARLAWEQDGIALDASNFAIGGYETWQQTVLMAQMLAERPAPDLVVFYGGYNDLHHYVTPGAPQEFSSTWAEDFVRALRESEATIALPSEDSVERNASWSPQNAAVLYDRAIGIAESILAARDIPFTHFLQPSLWTRDRPEDAATLDGIGADDTWARSFGAVYDAARASITSDVVDLSDALDELPGVVYWDEVHHNEAGNAVVAAAAYPDVRQQLLALTGASQGAGSP